MKVRVQFTVDIDPEWWSVEYSVHPDDVRSDVREAAETMVKSHFGELGLLLSGGNK